MTVFSLALGWGHGARCRVCNDTRLYLAGSLGGMCRVVDFCLPDRLFLRRENGDTLDKLDIPETACLSYVRDVSFYSPGGY